MKSAVKAIILAAIFSIFTAAVTTFGILYFEKNSQSELIKNFYMAENAVHASPHSIRKAMDKGDKSFILVDLRSQQEYEKEHIIGAISIPAYKDPDTSAYGDVERIVRDFSNLPKDKEIVVYCYSMPCMTGIKIGKMLAEHGIYVKHLGIGWNEWRHYWNLWNHEHEWNTTMAKDYVWKGREPGTPKLKINPQACLIEGDFGC